MSHARLAQHLADTLVLGSLLDEVRASFGRYELLAHWQQGEFHHDVLIELPREDPAPERGPRFMIVATNCNGGVKEVLCFDERPDADALWKHRCPSNPEFSGTLPPILARAVTPHWFDPCELLLDTARSELREEFRERQKGGGWVAKRSCGKP
ncbi:MAG: hypothetical protein U0414_09355 [Polyangiaceae bacterium]